MLIHGEDLEQYELLLLCNVRSIVTESQHFVGALRRRPNSEEGFPKKVT